MTWYNPDGMSNSTFVREDRDVGHMLGGREGGTVAHTRSQGGLRPNSRCAAVSSAS